MEHSKVLFFKNPETDKQLKGKEAIVFYNNSRNRVTFTK
jgi:hypothetical protein